MSSYTNIDNPEEYFKTVKYVGNATEPRNIDVGFQSDWVWVKDRTVAYHHRLFDSSRGGAPLYANQNKVEDHFNDGPELDFSSPYSNGFKIVDNPDGATNSYAVNENNSNIVAWNWKANGGTTSTNTDGSENSTVQANTTAGFSIVTFTTNGSTETYGHGLGAKPDVVIAKSRDTGGNWLLFTRKINGTHDYFTGLSSTAQIADISYDLPTTSVFSYNDNNNLKTVAYCFAQKQGYSRFNWYRGNGQSDGPNIFTGFRPAFVIIKGSTVTASWSLYDNQRENPFNPIDGWLRSNGPDAESTSAISGEDIDLLSNGFKIRNSDNTLNSSGQDYFYMAWAQHPFVTSEGVPTTAR